MTRGEGLYATPHSAGRSARFLIKRQLAAERPTQFLDLRSGVLSDADMKLGTFGYFCALELYGTLKPEDCARVNGRMAKALPYL